jgi:tetratricopeptide (TPR) repeat protein
MTDSVLQTQAEPSRTSRRWLRDGFAALFLIAATLITYWPAVHGTFIWDDTDHISNNMALRSPHGLWEIWFKPGATCQYYPMTFSGFWVGYQLWGLNPLGYHLLNVLLHGVVAVLLWQVLARLKVRGAWLAGAIFALHPVSVMTGAWMTELKNTLSAALALGAAWAYLRFAGLGVYEAATAPASDLVRSSSVTTPCRTGVRRTGSGTVWLFYVLSLVLFQLALFAKTAVSFLPVSLLLATWWRRERLKWCDVWPLIPMLGLIAVMSRLTLHVERLYGALGQEFNLRFLERVLISGRSFWFYLGKLLFPHQLTFIYERWQVDPGIWWQYLFPLAAAGVLVWLWLSRRRLGKGLFVALMHFYVCTSLLILLTVIYMTRYTFVSDHWQYFGCMSIMALVAAGITGALERFEKGRPFLKPAVCGMLLVALGVLSWRQCRMYTGLETLWRTTLARNPRAFLAQNNLGELLAQKGQMDEAVDHFQKALQIQPGFAEAHYNLGNALVKEGQLDNAIIQFQKTLEIEPDNAEAHNNLGWVLLQKKRLDEAIFHFQTALKFQPAFADAHQNLGNCFSQMGRLDEAIAHYQKALDIQPDNVKVQNNLGWVLLQKGRVDEAISHFQTALKIQPGFAMTHNNLAIALLRTGQVRDAIAQYQSSLKLQPNDVLALSDLAWVLATWPEASVRNGAQALELAQRANQLTGGQDPMILRVLAAAYAEDGQFAEAVANARQAIQLADSQSNGALADMLRSHLKRYQAGSSIREPSQIGSPRNLPGD